MHANTKNPGWLNDCHLENCYISKKSDFDEILHIEVDQDINYTTRKPS